MARRSIPSAPPRTRAAPPLAAWVLFLSLLPMLSFAGHWTFELPIPGTNLLIGPVPAPPPEHAHGGAAHNHHDDHCHGDAASCSDVPLTSLSGIATLREAVALLDADGRFELLAVRFWRPAHTETVAPELTPPRMAV